MLIQLRRFLLHKKQFNFHSAGAWFCPRVVCFFCASRRNYGRNANFLLFLFCAFRVQFFRRDLIRIRSEECSSTAHKSRWNGERLKQWAKWNSVEWKMRPLENWININLPVAPLRLPSFSMPHPPVIMNYLARHLSNDLAQLFFLPSFLFNQFFGWRQSDPLRPDIRVSIATVICVYDRGDKRTDGKRLRIANWDIESEFSEWKYNIFSCRNLTDEGKMYS